MLSPVSKTLIRLLDFEGGTFTTGGAKLEDSESGAFLLISELELLELFCVFWQPKSDNETTKHIGNQCFRLMIV